MLPMYLRVRPQPDALAQPWLEILDNTKVQHSDEQHVFKQIFDQEASQQEVYSTCVEPLISKVLDGQDQCFFALGATGSGKTWSTVGTDEDPGLIYRVIADLLDRRGGRMVSISMMEIYNDKVLDLFNNRLPISIRTVNSRCSTSAKSLEVVNFDTAKMCLSQGYASRAVNATNCNEQSSRSHAIVFIDIGSARLTIGDLAGNERVNDAGSTGSTLHEAGQINKSLMLFGQALQNLQQGRLAIKGSKLSQLLLVNAAATMPIMLVTMDIYYNEKPGKQVLRYATVARKIRRAPIVKATEGTSAEFENTLRRQLYQETEARLARVLESVWA